MKETHDAKGHDYGDEDEYANIHASAEFGIPPWIGVALRMNDKIHRLQKFARVGILKVRGESVLDSFLDLAVYGVIGHIMFEEEMDKEQIGGIYTKPESFSSGGVIPTNPVDPGLG